MKPLRKLYIYYIYTNVQTYSKQILVLRGQVIWDLDLKKLGFELDNKLRLGI